MTIELFGVEDRDRIIGIAARDIWRSMQICNGNPTGKYGGHKYGHVVYVTEDNSRYSESATVPRYVKPAIVPRHVYGYDPDDGF